MASRQLATELSTEHTQYCSFLILKINVKKAKTVVRQVTNLGATCRTPGQQDRSQPHAAPKHSTFYRFPDRRCQAPLRPAPPPVCIPKPVQVTTGTLGYLGNFRSRLCSKQSQKLEPARERTSRACRQVPHKPGCNAELIQAIYHHRLRLE